MKQINFSCIVQNIKINKYDTITIELKQHLNSFSTFRHLLLSPQLDIIYKSDELWEVAEKFEGELLLQER